MNMGTCIKEELGPSCLSQGIISLFQGNCRGVLRVKMMIILERTSLTLFIQTALVGPFSLFSAEFMGYEFCLIEALFKRVIYSRTLVNLLGTVEICVRLSKVNQSNILYLNFPDLYVLRTREIGKLTLRTILGTRLLEKTILGRSCLLGTVET